jgi:hypothetical protein
VFSNTRPLPARPAAGAGWRSSGGTDDTHLAPPDPRDERPGVGRDTGARGGGVRTVPAGVAVPLVAVGAVCRR